MKLTCSSSPLIVSRHIDTRQKKRGKRMKRYTGGKLMVRRSRTTEKKKSSLYEGKLNFDFHLGGCTDSNSKQQNRNSAERRRHTNSKKTTLSSGYGIKCFCLTQQTPISCEKPSSWLCRDTFSNLAPRSVSCCSGRSTSCDHSIHRYLRCTVDLPLYSPLYYF